jgi:hypothetical protein
VNLSAVGGIATDLAQTGPDAFGPNTVVRQMTVWAPAEGFDPFYVNFTCNALFTDVLFARAVTGSGEACPALFEPFLGCVHVNQVVMGAQDVAFAGGILEGGGQFTGDSFRNNVILASSLTADGSDLDDSELFLDTGVIFNATGHTFIAGASVLGHVYGPGVYNQASGTTEYHETASDHFIAALTIGGSSLAYSSVTTEGAVAVHQLALTAAAIDAPAGATGFGGLAYVPGVGAIHATGAAP